ncbi:MAG: alpha/beta fold hydrolase [Deltaproteobacteria bacterium]|nr:alpha/beta fold hydrolase [Deltaproteobacteria bacterium]
MTAINANRITIEYEESGHSSNPAIILIRGLGTQLIDWPKEFIEGLVKRDFRVIYHDNRDVGLSTKFEDAGIPDVEAAMIKVAAGETVEPVYTIDDMALDVIGLMDALSISKAHVLGISMGGAIAQKLAAKHADRVRSLISIMSGSGNPDLPRGKPEAIEALLSSPQDPHDRDSIIAHGTKLLGILGSPGYPESEETRRQIYTARYERCYYPPGIARQKMAILADGSRVELLKTITVPTLVIHGLDDPLVPVEAGRETAALIPNAELEIIEGMGHNIPGPLVPRLVKLIADHAAAHG